jgi:hypothetical protein
MGFLESRGYKFNNEQERMEAEQWLRKHPEMLPPKEEVVVEADKLTTWQVNRRQMLASWFGDWADTDGETFNSVSDRDAARKRLVEDAGLTEDEKEIVDALMDEWPRQEIMNYYNLERGQLARIEAGIEKKIRKARI